MDDLHKFIMDTVKNEVIPMRIAPNSVMFIAWNKRKGSGHISESGTTV
jgi:hypothetical protein